MTTRRQPRQPRSFVARYIVGNQEADKVTPRIWTWLAVTAPEYGIIWTRQRDKAARFATPAAAKKAADVVNEYLRGYFEAHPDKSPFSVGVHKLQEAS